MKKNIKFPIINRFKSPYLKGMDFFVFLFFSSLTTFGQLNHIDTIIDAVESKPRFIIKLDSKFSFVTNQLVLMRGVKVGAIYNDKVKLGGGYSWMKNNFKFDNPTPQVNNDIYDLRYSHISIFGDYNFHNSGNWSYLFNIDIAYAKLGYKNKTTKHFDYRSIGFVFEPSAMAEYRFWNYFIVGSGLGYRMVFRQERQISERFTAPILIVRLKADFNKIHKEIIKK